MKAWKIKIKTKLNIMVIGILLITIIFIITSFAIFFKPYYVGQESDILLSVYGGLKVESMSLEELKSELAELEQKHNLNFIIGNNKEYMYSTNRWYKQAGEQELIFSYDNSVKDKILSGMMVSPPPKAELKSVLDVGTGLTFLQIVSDIKIEGKMYTLIIEKPIAGLNQVVFSNLVFILTCMIPIFCIAALLIAVSSEFFVKPILLLTEKTKKIAELKFDDVDIGDYSTDELSILGSSINTMSISLQEKTESLKKTNNQLRLELERKELDENSRKDFISAASHELKTPITIIMGYAEALKDDVVAIEKKQRYYDVIIEESKKMNKLVVELTEAMKTQTMLIERRKIDIIALINENIDRYGEILDKYKFEFESDCSEYFIFADSKNISTVIDNFISNAIRYCDERKNIKITCKKNKDSITIRFYNSSSQIAILDKSLLWSSFFKADESRNREKGGSGLGLYIVKSILDLHEYIYDWENINNGVEFSITTTKYIEEIDDHL